jgi:hypothetical protein
MAMMSVLTSEDERRRREERQGLMARNVATALLSALRGLPAHTDSRINVEVAWVPRVREGLYALMGAAQVWFVWDMYSTVCWLVCWYKPCLYDPYVDVGVGVGVCRVEVAWVPRVREGLYALMGAAQVWFVVCACCCVLACLLV